MRNLIKRCWNWLTGKDIRKKYDEEATKFIDLNKKIAEIPKESPTPEPEIPKPSFDESLDEMFLQQKREEQERDRWLAAPTTKRRRIPRHERIPAARHSHRIAKLMHGKGSKHQHKTYRKSVLAHKGMEEED